MPDLIGYGYGYGSLAIPGEGTSSGYITSGYGYGISSGYCSITLASVKSGYGINDGVFALEFKGWLAGYGESDGKVISIYGVVPEQLTNYILSIDTKRTYQYSNYEFLGIGRFNGKVLGARDNKIFDLETETAQDGADNIDAYLEFATDFAIPNNKAFRAIYVEDDKCVVILVNQDGSEFLIEMPYKEFASIPRDIISKSWKIRIHNQANGKTTIRRITGKISNLAMKGG